MEDALHHGGGGGVRLALGCSIGVVAAIDNILDVVVELMLVLVLVGGCRAPASGAWAGCPADVVHPYRAVSRPVWRRETTQNGPSPAAR